MAVLTISRQIGSNGRQIGERVAACLGYRIIWREVINQAALRSGAPSIALAMIDEFHLLGLSPSDAECQAYIQAVGQVVNEFAEQDNVVIVGRAGQTILAGHPNTFHARIIAPLDLRARRLMERHNISLQAALAQVKASDRNRQNYLKRFYLIRWDDPTFYDLILNTAQLSNDAAAGILCALVQSHHTGERV